MPSKKLFIGKQHVIIIRPKYIKYGIAHTQKKVKRIVAIPEWKFWMFYVFGDGMLMILFYRKHGSTSATQTWLKKSTTEKLQLTNFTSATQTWLKKSTTEKLQLTNFTTYQLQHQPLKHGSKNLQLRNYNVS